jgi:alkanesulfonate monooxygenase SsuD/methylene tetrahydromethanopterin reductase-like flavin-dependent oxidoreductase (luciferase family)
MALLDQRCRDIGRQPAEIERTVTLNVVVRSDRPTAERDWNDIARLNRPQPGEGELEAGGSPRDVAAALGAYRELGVGQAIWVLRPPWDLETIRRLPDVRQAMD